MEQETKETGGAQPANNGVDSKEDKVAYESFQRAVDETKRFKSEAQQLREKLEALEAEKMERNGSLEEALNTYKEQASQLKSENEKLKTTFAQTQINNRIESALMERGCKEPKKALRIMDDKDYNALLADVDDRFNVGNQTLSFVLDKFQKENDFFFGRKAPSIADGVPSTQKPETPEGNRERALRAIREAKTKEEYEKAVQESLKHF